MVHNVIESYLAQSGHPGVEVDFEYLHCHCGRVGEMLCRDPQHHTKRLGDSENGYDGCMVCFICYELGRGRCAVCRDQEAVLTYLNSHRIPLSAKSNLLHTPEEAYDLAFAQAAIEALTVRWDGMAVYEQVIKRQLEELCHQRPPRPKDPAYRETNQDQDFALVKACLAAFANKYGIAELYYNVITLHMRDWDADMDMFEEIAWIVQKSNKRRSAYG